MYSCGVNMHGTHATTNLRAGNVREGVGTELGGRRGRTAHQSLLILVLSLYCPPTFPLRFQMHGTHATTNLHKGKEGEGLGTEWERGRGMNRKDEGRNAWM